ncbi:MAG: Abi family protein [Lachnospiraceae bacterium]|nr:Abi family protein [Lachnospiraceae bacterium]
MKEMLNADKLIQHMKDKGIQFNIVSEESAKEFLLNNNYYMKLAAYRTNYEKRTKGKEMGKYVNLEFAYLQELSTIDMRLRYIIIDMCLDIEHYIKVLLLNRVEPKEDGYQLIRKFVTKNERILKSIYGHRTSDYCSSLIDKYYPYFPIWVFVELISFGDLTYLCEFYHEMYNEELIDNKFMNLVRDLRNASAHSNCLINKIKEELKGEPDKRIFDFVKSLRCVGKGSISNNLRKSFMYNFIVLLYVYEQIVSSQAVKRNRYRELEKLVNERMIKNKCYFEKNNAIKSQYTFVKKIVDKLNENSYTDITIEKR